MSDELLLSIKNNTDRKTEQTKTRAQNTFGFKLPKPLGNFSLKPSLELEKGKRMATLTSL